MGQQIRIIAIIAIVFTSCAALAEAPVSKSALRVDFNKMIEDNNNQRKDLHQDIDVRADDESAQPQAAVKKDDKGKVIDFIDVEVGVGQAPSVVDRRYDSVGEPKLADPAELLIKN
jgi:hypothetical protein